MHFDEVFRHQDPPRALERIPPVPGTDTDARVRSVGDERPPRPPSRRARYASATEEWDASDAAVSGPEQDETDVGPA